MKLVLNMNMRMIGVNQMIKRLLFLSILVVSMVVLSSCSKTQTKFGLMTFECTTDDCETPNY